MVYRTVPVFLLLLVVACNRPAIAPGHGFSLRLGSDTPASGMVETEMLATSQMVFVAQQDIVSAKDILEVKEIEDYKTGRPLISIALNRQAGDSLESVTADNVGELCVVLVNNRAVLALRINEPIGRMLIIEGDFSGSTVKDAISEITGYRN